MSSVLRLFLAMMLAWAGVSKVLVAQGSTTVYEVWITDYPLLKWAIPGGEILLAVWLLSGRKPRASSLAAILLLSAFTGLLLLETMRVHPRPCGCFGPVPASDEPAAIRIELFKGICRNVVMLAGISYLYLKASARAVNGRVLDPVTQPG
jgi:hypothetical protein